MKITVLPAQAGVIPVFPLCALIMLRTPRASGGDPLLNTFYYHTEMYSPRKRG